MQTVSTDQLVGQTVGHYTVKSLLGRGRLSAVYLAQHPAQNQSAALTTFIVPDRFTRDAHTRFTQRFTREAAALTALSHRNLLPIHEYGEQFGYPYLITPYMANGSLADTLKQQGRCTPAYVLEVLEQVAAGLDYAHRKGVFHGTLKPSNILLGADQHLLVAGFGLVHMLQMRGIEQNDQPYSYLLSIADTFLYASAYIAPEVVQGQPIDSRSDIYALGVMLFELLSGKPPFAGTSPLDTAMQHVQRSVPSLHKLSPDIPISMELVVSHALSRDPSQRFQRVSELVEAFSQVCKGSVSRSPNNYTNDSAPIAAVSKLQSNFQNVTEEPVSLGGWQVMPPILTNKLGIVRQTNEAAAQAHPGAFQPFPGAGNTDSWQILPPIVTGRMAAVRPTQQPPAAKPPIVRQPAADLLLQKDAFQPPKFAQLEQKAAAEPLVRSVPLAKPAASGDSTISDADAMKTPTWWIQAPSPLAASAMGKTPDTPRMSQTDKSAMQPASDSIMRIRPAKRSRGMGRRRAIATIVGGGVVAAGALAAYKLNLLHLMQPLPPPVAKGGTTAPPNKPKQAGGAAGNTGKGNNPTGNNGNANTGNGGVKAGGTLLAKTNGVAANSSMTIVNPADGKNSLLIHLPNGNFVAYESACTHVGVTVAYDPGTHTLVCPAHGAVFDPAKNAAVLQGPAQRPLKPVAIHVNADGTITAG